MKIMTFNIQHALDYKNQVIDIDLFADSIKKFGADVCGLNEVRNKGVREDYADQTGIIADRIGFNGYFAEAIKFHNGDDPYGNALVSRYPIKSAETIIIPEPEVKIEGRRYETRCVLNALLDVDGKELRVLVCHMGLTSYEQKDAVKVICSILDSTDTPTVAMGDFNLLPENPILEPLRERMKDTDAYAEAPGAFTFRSDNPMRKIDYIFFRGLECRSTRTIAEIVSDHFPIIADFEFENN